MLVPAVDDQDDLGNVSPFAIPEDFHHRQLGFGNFVVWFAHAAGLSKVEGVACTAPEIVMHFA